MLLKADNWELLAGLAGLAIFATVMGLFLLPRLRRHLDKLLLGLILLAPFHTLVRALKLESVLLSGWRDLLYLTVLAVWILGRVRRNPRITTVPVLLAVLLLNLAGLLQVFQAPSLVLGAAGFRDIIKYSLLALVTHSVCRERPGFLRQLVHTLFAVGVLVVVLQFIFYYLDLDFVLRLGMQPPTMRGLGPFQIRRMEAFFGGAPSNLGLYLGVPLVLFAALRQGPRRLSTVWQIGALLLMCGLLMTLSFSAVISVAVVSFLLLFGARRRSLLIILLLAVAVWFFVQLAAGFDYARLHGQEADNFAAYFSNIFYRALFLRNWQILTGDRQTFLIGRGLAVMGAKSFLDGTGSDSLMIVGSSDGGWLEFAIQVGAPLAALLLGAVLFTLWRAVRGSSRLPPVWRAYVRGLAAALLVMLSSIHIVPWIRVGPDVNFWIVLGALASVPGFLRDERTDTAAVENSG